MSTDNQATTKKDLKNLTGCIAKDLINLKEDIVEELSEVFSESMTIIGMNFQSLKDDNRQIKATINRMEHKLDSTIDTSRQPFAAHI